MTRTSIDCINFIERFLVILYLFIFSASSSSFISSPGCVAWQQRPKHEHEQKKTFHSLEIVKSHSGHLCSAHDVNRCLDKEPTQKRNERNKLEKIVNWTRNFIFSQKEGNEIELNVKDVILAAWIENVWVSSYTQNKQKIIDCMIAIASKNTNCISVFFFNSFFIFFSAFEMTFCTSTEFMFSCQVRWKQDKRDGTRRMKWKKKTCFPFAAAVASDAFCVWHKLHCCSSHAIHLTNSRCAHLVRHHFINKISSNNKWQCSFFRLCRHHLLLLHCLCARHFVCFSYFYRNHNEINFVIYFIFGQIFSFLLNLFNFFFLSCVSIRSICVIEYRQ